MNSLKRQLSPYVSQSHCPSFCGRLYRALDSVENHTIERISDTTGSIRGLSVLLILKDTEDAFDSLK